ncbi:TonB-dependent receptor plug domain-containing protein [Hufsiella ginkgonis]|uniref:TonB-dependent receptor n=1 Tax=Hufsiella ginkgonis TaxID=2695274 RepID=A0A7K1XRX6_9SPHI|nr:TonB-dependent receptor [Hufsiella ginkgonis]MXV13743.1 TonB-dependent receptor [Hufsiella ginkgonis]
MRKAIQGLLMLFAIPVCAQVKGDAADRLPDTTRKLSEVSLTGNAARLLRQSPGNVTVIDLKPYYSTNTTPVQLLRSTPGVKVKQDGGYGSRVDFFINGSTGKQLKFFLDGLPLDNLGETTGINNLPVEQIERVEIYKGVIPVDLGADILGGAINIVTRKDRDDYFDASYGLSSFGTHKVNLSGRKNWSDRLYTVVRAYSGYARNNYQVDAANINASSQLETIRVKRFHDRYKNYVVKAEAGLRMLPWADELSFSLSRNGLDRELQNNLTMSQPYAHATYAEGLTAGTLKYQKSGLFSHLSLSGFLSASRVHGTFTDTSANVITWDGRIADRRLKGAELGPAAMRNTYTDAYAARLSASWWLSKQSRFIASSTLNRYRRTGKDELAARLTGDDLYSAPSSQLKNVLGAGFEDNSGERLKWSAGVKNFYARMDGFSIQFDKRTTIIQHNSYWGYSAATAFDAGKGFLLKASFEHAIRLPDVEEAFGDLMLLNPNPSLKAEESNNLNLNVLYRGDHFDAEAGGFLRDVDHLIFLVPNSQGSAKTYNLLRARVQGVEISANYRLPKGFVLNANATYQDLRNQSTIENEGIPNERYKDQRIPNIPYLLGNTGLSFNRHGAGKKAGLSAWYALNYTHDYFLYWEIDGDPAQKHVIPQQLLQNAGVSLSFPKLTFSFESYNLADARTYDNFRSQLPGRSFSLKTRLYLNQKK